MENKKPKSDEYLPYQWFKEIKHKKGREKGKADLIAIEVLYFIMQEEGKMNPAESDSVHIPGSWRETDLIRGKSKGESNNIPLILLAELVKRMRALPPEEPVAVNYSAWAELFNICRGKVVTGMHRLQEVGLIHAPEAVDPGRGNEFLIRGNLDTLRRIEGETPST
jgi:hypothetical protein